MRTAPSIAMSAMSLAFLFLAHCGKNAPTDEGAPESGDPPAPLVGAGDPSAGGAGGAADAWVEVRSTAGNFSVRLPHQPTEATTPTPTAVGPMDNHIFMVETGTRAYMVSYGDIPAVGADKVRDPRAQKALLSSAKDNWVGQVHNGTIGSEKPFDLSGFGGTEVVVTGDLEGVTGKVAIVVRTALVNERLYQFGVLMLASEPYQEEAAKLFGSFKLIDAPAKKELPPVAWKEFVSAEGRFAVLFPGTPEASNDKADTQAGGVALHSFKASDPASDTLVMVGYGDLPAGSGTPAMAKSILDHGRDSAVDAVRGRLVSEAEIKLDKYPGRELFIEAPVSDPTILAAVVRARAYLVQDRMYYIQVIRERPKDPKAPEPEIVTKVLDSFRLVPNP